jgi:nucleotide-binding universal stress UspA family protein
MGEPLVPEAVDAVLVPVDSSPFSWSALATATRLARRLGARLRLFSTVSEIDDVEGRDAELAAADAPAISVERAVVVNRDRAGAIHEALRLLDGSLACMATHGRGAAALVGSVATEWWPGATTR